MNYVVLHICKDGKRTPYCDAWQPGDQLAGLDRPTCGLCIALAGYAELERAASAAALHVLSDANFEAFLQRTYDRCVARAAREP